MIQSTTNLLYPSKNCRLYGASCAQEGHSLPNYRSRPHRFRTPYDDHTYRRQGLHRKSQDTTQLFCTPHSYMNANLHTHRSTKTALCGVFLPP